MLTKKYQVKETIVTVTADEQYHRICMDSITRSRADLKQYILGDPFFKVTFEPYKCTGEVPEVVRRMADSSARVGVGPMAAVAGTIAWLALEDMVRAGCRFGIIDNGGDIALINDHPLVVGIYAGESSIKGLGLEIEPRERILGICTSSGTVGPSISLGNSDAALIVSDDVSLADAAATALGNRIKDNGSLTTAFDFLKDIPQVAGAIGIIGDHMATYGKLPEIVRADVEYEKITKGG